MKLILISDTHGFHHQLVLPEGDALIHTGDVSKRGHRLEVIEFLDWFKDQPFEHKIFIAGNHDFFFEEANDELIESMIPPGITYLNDSGTSIDGLRIWGSPVQPRFFDWAFNRDRGADIDRHWQLIPPDVDVLLTHGPPHGILDRTFQNLEVGCKMLLKKIEEVKPKLSVFGHIHEGYGMVERNGTTFINASVVNLQYQVVNAPVIWEI